MICTLILWHLSANRANHHLFSVDEKTGIQALERKELMAMGSGKINRTEYEYRVTRHELCKTWHYLFNSRIKCKHR